MLQLIDGRKRLCHIHCLSLASVPSSLQNTLVGYICHAASANFAPCRLDTPGLSPPARVTVALLCLHSLRDDAWSACKPLHLRQIGVCVDQPTNQPRILSLLMIDPLHTANFTIACHVYNISAAETETQDSPIIYQNHAQRHRTVHGLFLHWLHTKRYPV